MCLHQLSRGPSQWMLSHSSCRRPFATALWQHCSKHRRAPVPASTFLPGGSGPGLERTILELSKTHDRRIWTLIKCNPSAITSAQPKEQPAIWKGTAGEQGHHKPWVLWLVAQAWSATVVLYPVPWRSLREKLREAWCFFRWLQARKQARAMRPKACCSRRGQALGWHFAMKSIEMSLRPTVIVLC